MRDNISHNRSSFTHKASYLFIQSCVDFNIICQGLEYRLHCVRVQVWARNTELTQMLIPINPKLSRWRMKQIWRHSKWNNETKVLRVGVDPMAFRMGGGGGGSLQAPEGGQTPHCALCPQMSPTSTKTAHCTNSDRSSPRHYCLRIYCVRNQSKSRVFTSL